VEIPYVAASQRPTKQVKDEERDTIVIVGQPRQKRKRIKVQQQQDDAGRPNELVADAVPSSSALPSKKEEAEPFDFSAVPNILDDNPDLQDSNRKKKRQKKQNKSQLLLPLSFTSTLEM